MSNYISQTITVSSCQSDTSNQCRIKTPCITGMAEKSVSVRGGGGGLFGESRYGRPVRLCEAFNMGYPRREMPRNSVPEPVVFCLLLEGVGPRRWTLGPMRPQYLCRGHARSPPPAPPVAGPRYP